MRFFKLFMLMIVAAGLTPIFGWSFTINEVQPGAATAATPISVGTSTPVPIQHCGSTLNAGATNTNTLYMQVQVQGGTVGTDGCYIAPAAVASPCAAASPAPNAATKVGIFVPTGGNGFGQPYVINFPTAGGGAIISSEWDAVCTAASMVVGRSTLP